MTETSENAFFRLVTQDKNFKKATSFLLKLILTLRVALRIIILSFTICVTTIIFKFSNVKTGAGSSRPNRE